MLLKASYCVVQWVYQIFVVSALVPSAFTSHRPHCNQGCPAVVELRKGIKLLHQLLISLGCFGINSMKGALADSMGGQRGGVFHEESTCFLVVVSANFT